MLAYDGQFKLCATKYIKLKNILEGITLAILHKKVTVKRIRTSTISL